MLGLLIFVELDSCCDLTLVKSRHQGSRFRGLLRTIPTKKKSRPRANVAAGVRSRAMQGTTHPKKLYRHLEGMLSTLVAAGLSIPVKDLTSLNLLGHEDTSE